MSSLLHLQINTYITIFTPTHIHEITLRIKGRKTKIISDLIGKMIERKKVFPISPCLSMEPKKKKETCLNVSVSMMILCSVGFLQKN